MWPWRVKIPIDDFTDVTLAIGGTYGDDARGGDGDDKVADMVLRIPNEDFTDGTVVIDDIIRK